MNAGKIQVRNAEFIYTLERSRLRSRRAVSGFHSSNLLLSARRASNWFFEIDQTTGDQLWSRLAEIQRDPAKAKAKVNSIMPLCRRAKSEWYRLCGQLAGRNGKRPKRPAAYRPGLCPRARLLEWNADGRLSFSHSVGYAKAAPRKGHWRALINQIDAAVAHR